MTKHAIETFNLGGEKKFDRPENHWVFGNLFHKSRAYKKCIQDTQAIITLPLGPTM